MKKIFTSLLMLGAAFAASAQNFVVNSVDGPVANGATLTVGYTVEQDGDLTIYGWDPELTVTANKSATYTVTASANVAGVVQFCGITGQCQILNSTPRVRSGAYSAGQSFSLALDIIDAYEKLEEEIATEVTVSDGIETIKFTVNFVNVEQAGIKSVAAPSNALRFSGRTLSFSLDNPANFALFNINGRQMMSRSLSGTGSVNLTAIPAGVYVYRCGATTGKVIIK